MTRFARTVSLLVLLLALAGSASSAQARTLRPIMPSDPTEPAWGPFHDRVFSGVAHASARDDGPPPGTTRTYRLPSGAGVSVTLSPSFPDGSVNRASAQSYADFIDTRLHGSELGRLKVYIGTPAEINDICGGEDGTLACYARGLSEMFVPSDDPSKGGPFTRDYAVTHEYGHHIAANRSNYPFAAIDYGAKYWASYEHVCSGVSSHLYYPADEAKHYLSNPGEGWADSYAHLHYPSVPFQYNADLRPDAGAFAAIRRDILQPWRAPKVRTFTGTLRRGAASKSMTLAIALDGRLNIKLRGPRGANYNVSLLDSAGRVLTATHSSRSADQLGATFCRASRPTVRLVVRVVRVSGAGRFSLSASYPG